MPHAGQTTNELPRAEAPSKDAAAIVVQQRIVRQVKQLQVRQPAQLQRHETNVAVHLHMTSTPPHKRFRVWFYVAKPTSLRPAASSVAGTCPAPMYWFIVQHCGSGVHRTRCRLIRCHSALSATKQTFCSKLPPISRRLWNARWRRRFSGGRQKRRKSAASRGRTASAAGLGGPWPYGDSTAGWAQWAADPANVVA